MQYKGHELVEVTEPQVFNPPKKMLVWDSQDDSPTLEIVYAITKEATYPVVIDREDYGVYDAKMFCAEIPEEPKPRRATNRELAKWLAQCNGEMTFKSNSEIDHIVYTLHCYEEEYADEECDRALKRDDDGSWIVVRKWDDDEWHEPTAEYLGLEVK